MEIKIIKSPNRRKTISARLIKDTMLVSTPADVPQDKLDEIIKNLKTRLEKRKIKKDLNSNSALLDRTNILNQKYFGGDIVFESIEYSANQNRLFGSCNHQTKKIRISHRLASMPEWVRDYVIIHELAHIVEPNHGKAFWELVYRYDLAERARGFLTAKGYESIEEDF